MKRITVYCILLFFALSCQVSKYRKEANGIVISLTKHPEAGAGLLRLQVVSDKIIRVSATKENELSKDNSLMVVDQPAKPVKWDVKEKNDTIVLSTSALKAVVSLVSGQVIFTDTTGAIILKENHGGGKTFVPYTVDNKSLYHIRQVFESPADEAFYGLGQHQNSVMNFKGQDVDLFQYNTMVAIPFVVSNKNYGILWDNYSLTKFGDPRDYEPLSTFKLCDAEGKSGGLTAVYCNKEDSSKVYLKRIEQAIDNETLPLKNIPKEFPMADGKVVWSGSIESDLAGDHKFRIYSAGYIKAWVEGKQVVAEKWRQCWNPAAVLFTIAMEKGKKYPVRIEWTPDAGQSYIAVKHLTPQAPGEQEKLSLYSEAGKQIDYYFIKGKNMDEVVSGYRQLTGKAPIMPKWAYGLWQSRQRYKTQEELLSVVKEYRKREVPFDNIVLDWQYWPENKWGEHTFDIPRFPDATGMIKELHSNLNANIMISVWPKFYEGTENFNKMNEKGYLYQKNLELKHKDWVGPGYYSTFYDAFNPKARKMFWSLMNEKLFSKGIDAWWLDAAEPDIHSNLSVKERQDLMNPTALGSGVEYFNGFPLQNAKAVYEGQRGTKPDQRVFILTRSAYAGSQRYGAAVWSGDIGSRWYDMKAQISAGANFSISGLPNWTMDIGGFSVEHRYEKPSAQDLDEWRELQTRWVEFGSFCPLFRMHGEFPLREFYNIAPDNHPAYQTMVAYDKLRYHLMPYIYSLGARTWFDDYTIMRPLVMDFGSDVRVLNINDQYMFGPSLLISPVCEYKARSRKVYLPATTGWYDLYTGKFQQGGKVVDADAPLSKIPVFVKEGTILPFGPDIQYSTQKTDGSITLFVYGGKDASFDLYEDENINYNYEKGQYSLIPITYSEKSHVLTIGNRKGSFTGMVKDRSFKVIYVTEKKAVGLDLKQKPEKEVKYNGSAVTMGL